MKKIKIEAGTSKTFRSKDERLLDW